MSKKLGQRPTGMNPYNNPVPELSTVNGGELFKTPKTQRQVRSRGKR